MQPPDARADHFQVLGAQRRYAQDLGALERRFKELTKRLHPDRFARSDPRARRASLGRTVQLNEAWRTLRDPVRRAEYLLSLAGVEVAAEEGTVRRLSGGTAERVPVPQALLIEALERREALAEARDRGDRRALAALGAEVRTARAAAMHAVERGFAETAPDHAQIAAALVAVRYHDRFLEEALAAEERGAEDEPAPSVSGAQESHHAG